MHETFTRHPRRTQAAIHADADAQGAQAAQYHRAQRHRIYELVDGSTEGDVMPLNTNSWQRAEAEDLLANGYGHYDLGDMQDYQVYAWLEELGFDWDGHAWVRVEDAEPMPKFTVPRKPKAHKSDAEKLAAWQKMVRGK